MVFLISLSSLNQLTGQEAKEVSGPSFGGLGFYTPGINTIQFNKLNDVLPAGYPVITNKPLLTGGSGYFIFSNVMIGGELGTIRGGSFTRDQQQVDLSGDYHFFSLGYVVLNRKGIVVYPTVSIGNNNLQIYIHQKDEPASFATVTGEPFQSATLHDKTRMLKFAVSGLYSVTGNKSAKGADGFMVGLQAGYQMAYRDGDWNYDSGAVTDGPDFSTNGFFIQLMIGGGGVKRK